MNVDILGPIVYLFCSYIILYIEMFVRGTKDKDYLRVYLPLNFAGFVITCLFLTN